MSAETIEYIWERSVVGGENCWLWQLRRNPQGYGRLSFRGKKGALAHRVAWELSRGRPIPDGMTVDHLCFNPPCVNPAHLRLLTRSENASNRRDAFLSHCTNGHEWTPENTYMRGPGKRFRGCLACSRESALRRSREKKAIHAE